MLRGGFGTYAGFLDDSGLQRILDEAKLNRRVAVESKVLNQDNEEVRGGNPPRCFLSAPGGVIQDSFFRSPWMLQTLQSITGVSVRPSGDRGTYTYYTRAKDFLSLHRDIETCDMAVITCLANNRPQARSGSLRVYPGKFEDRLSEIKASCGAGSSLIQLMAGQTLVLLGGLLPHEVLPVDYGQERIVSVLCYELLA
jgi:hypothetical protein